MSRSKYAKPGIGYAGAKPKTVKLWKQTERRRERRFLNSNLDDDDMAKVAKKKYHDKWEHPLSL